MVCRKNGYYYRISYGNLKYGRNPSLWGFNNIENLDRNILVLLEKKQCKSKYLGHSIVIKNKKKRIQLHFKCECGNNFNKILEDAVYKNYILCPNCVRLKIGNKRRLGRKVVDYLESVGYTVFDKNYPYKNNDYVEVEDSLGFRGFVTYSHIHGRNDGMSYFDERVNKKYYVYNVNHYAKLKGLNAECLGFVEKRHTRTSLLFRCECGEEFVTSISSFQNGKIRCAKCAKSISRYEFIFKKYLDKLGIEYIYQYTDNKCRDILPLPFDFYLVKYKCLVEIDGEGHFHPCNFNQISNEDAQKTFEITKAHDEIKNTFCQNNQIPLLRISYKEFQQNDNYKNLFQKFIEELTTP